VTTSEPTSEIRAAGDDAEGVQLRQRAHAAGVGIDWSREDDHAVRAFVAWAAPAAAADGPGLHRLTPKLTVAAAPPPAAASRARAAAASPAPPPAADPASLRPDLDAAAMVQVLRQAARDGSAFCEECAKAEAAA